MIEFGYKTFVITGILALAVGLWALIVGACREELLKVLERFNRLSRPIQAGLCAIVAMLALFAGAKHGQPTNPPPCCALGVGKRSPDRLSEKSSVDLNPIAVDRADFWELLQFVENGGLVAAVFYVCRSIGVCG